MMLRWYLLIDIIIRRFWLTWHNPPVAIKSHIDKWNHASVWTTWGRSWYPLCTELQWMFLSPENERISPNNWWLDDIFFWNGPFSGDMLTLGWVNLRKADLKPIVSGVIFPLKDAYLRQAQNGPACRLTFWRSSSICVNTAHDSPNLNWVHFLYNIFLRRQDSLS